MTLGSESRLQGLLCALAVVVCEFISLPFTTMGVCDDGPYIRMAQTFANTGHIVYNGWGSPMMAAQLCLAAGFIKLFGFSTTTVRMSTLLLATVVAFVLHRTLVRTGCSGRNATIGTLAIAVSPMYLALSGTFMTDIAGLFATTLCLYGCVRAIQASGDRSSIGWICFAVFTCAAFGTSRQIAWLGDIVMVPCTLWLLRSRRRVVIAGVFATALAFLFILACTHWLSNQPYAVPMLFIGRAFSRSVTQRQLSYIVLELPFLVLPVIVVFIPRILRSCPFIRFLLLAALVAYVAIAFHSRNDVNARLHFEPTAGYGASWINVYGVATVAPGMPVVLHTIPLLVLTIICLSGLLGVVAVLIQTIGAKMPQLSTSGRLPWKQLGILLLPFSVMYLIFLGAAAGTTHAIYDRYAIVLLGPTIIVLLRLYQEHVRRSLPFASVLLVILMAAYGIIVTHNTFALERTRVQMANELHANGIPFAAIDGGWVYNVDTELQISNHINNPQIKVPAGAYVIPPPAPPGYCEGFWHDKTPHVRAVYGITFDPETCYGRAPFAPVQYRPWLFNSINLYAVRYAPPNAVVSQQGARSGEQKTDDSQ